jgi:hypothetical protein
MPHKPLKLKHTCAYISHRLAVSKSVFKLVYFSLPEGSIKYHEAMSIIYRMFQKTT